MDPMAIIEAMKDPQMRHAAIVHMPVAISIIGLLLALVSACFLGRNHSLRWVACGAYVVLVGFAKLAERSGEDAEHAMSGMLAAVDVVSKELHEHEDMAQKVWIMGIVCAVVIALSAIPQKKMQAITSWIAVLAAGATALWVGGTAHHGGALVYEYGAGAPLTPVVGVVDQPAGETGGYGEAIGSEGGNEVEPGGASGGDPRLAHFREHIKPVLIDNCIKCHNNNRHKADLNLMSMGIMLGEGWSGPAIVPGDPDASWLIKAVRHEEELEMPAKADKLSDEIIAQLEKWVRDGAVWESLGEFEMPVETDDAKGVNDANEGGDGSREG